MRILAPLAATLAVAVVASTAICQTPIGIPAHGSVYTGFSRGLSFTSTVTTTITALELPLDAFVAGDTASFLVDINGTTIFTNVGGTSPIVATSLVVVPGDVVTVVGNWSPAAPGQFTARNSYGSSPAPYSTTISGVPHDLYRAGLQWDIGDPVGSAGLTPFNGNIGSIGRVIVHETPATGIATKIPFGSACYAAPRMFSEFFPAGTAAIDLVNTSWTLAYTPTAAGGNYTVSAGGLPYDAATAAAAGTDLVTGAYTSSSSANWDDASIVQTLPFALPFPNATGATTTDLTVNSNGRLYFGSTFDGSYGANGANSGQTPGIFAGTIGPGLPIFAAFMTDLDPDPISGSGNMWYEDPSPNGGVRITWDNVPNWQDTAAGAPLAVANYIQIELLPSGIIFLSFGPSLGVGGHAFNEGMVGYSAGGGEPELRLDWSTLNGYVSGNGRLAPTIDADANPVLGTTINVTVADLPSTTVLGGIIYGLTKLDPGIPLAGVLGVECDLHASLDLLLIGAAAGTTFTNAFTIPATPALVGQQLVAQGLGLDPSVPNPLGAIMSHGLELNLGN